MTDIDSTIRQLLVANPLREPVLRAAIQALRLPRASHGLDAGCGVGLQALLLAEAVGCDGHVTGVDIAPELLAFGETLICDAGLGEQITLREADVSRLPFADDSFDWAWSADCIGYPAGELAPLLRELMRVVRAGGTIALAGWSSQQLLPGHPMLEAHLNAVCSSYMPFYQGKHPDQHFLRALHWFREAGLEQTRAQTFVRDVHAPLQRGERAALESLVEMLWAEPASSAADEEWSAFKRLCVPGSVDSILSGPDYFGFFTYSVFRATVTSRSKVQRMIP
jgi:demethylmenaquinone methyltransferase/2-methoxy-6-polyprenyl-1,4-benzoquinol methylase